MSGTNPLIEKLEESNIKVSKIFDEKKIPYKRGWKDLLICCPFHNDSRPSMTVKENWLAFHCFWCKTKGTIVKLLAKLLGVNYRKILEELGIEIDDNSIPTDEKLQELFEKLNKVNENSLKEEEYLFLEEDILEKYKIYWVADIPAYLLNRFKGDFKGIQSLIEKYGIWFHREQNFITIPIRDENWLLMAVYGRNAKLNASPSEPRYKMFEKIEWFSKNKYIFNIENNLNSEELILVEWPFNAMLLNLYGINNVVSMYGTDIKSEQIQLLLKNRRRLFIWVDADRAGTSCLLNLHKYLDWKVDLFYLQTEQDAFYYTKEQIFQLFNTFRPLFVYNNIIYNV